MLRNARKRAGTEIMKLHKMNVPTPEEIAQCMGLRDLRIGRHFLRDGSGERSGCVSVCTLWYAEVVPSFQPRIALSVVTATGESFKDCCSPNFVKGVLATAEASHVLVLDADPMRHALKGIDLFCSDQTPPAHDGIAYTFTFQSLHLQGTLQFGNPSHACLRTLEDALLQLGRNIATDFGEAKLLAALEGWSEFVQGKK
jgi:hypothetical protein